MIETDKKMNRRDLLNQPMRVQIAGLQCTVIISLSWGETNELCLSFNEVSWVRDSETRLFIFLVFSHTHFCL